MLYFKTWVPLVSVLIFSPSLAHADAKSLLSPITDKAHWSVHNYGGTKVKVALVKSEDPTAIKVKVGAIDNQTWHARVEHVPISGLTDGTWYTLKFRAKSDVPRILAPYGQTADGNYHFIGLGANEHLGTAWTTYTESFKVSKATGHKVLISFAVGQHTGTVWISDVSLVKGQQKKH